MRQQTGRPWGVVALAWGLCLLFVAMWLAPVALHLSGSGTLEQVSVRLAIGWAVVGALVALSFVFQGLVAASVAEVDRSLTRAAGRLRGTP